MKSDGNGERANWGLNPISFDGTRTPLKTALFLLVCLAWMLPGLVGHDPWKFDEAVVFGVVVEMLRSGDWLDFRIAGEAYAGVAPLILWTAAGLAKLLGGLLPLHDAARLAAGIYMAATLGLLSATSHELLGERAMRTSVLLLIGCLGLLIRAHEMTPDLAGLAGVALGLYGLALSLRRPWPGGALAGLGAGLGYLGNGLLPLGMLATLLVMLPLAAPAWRTRQYALTGAIAIGCALPLLAAWPPALRNWSDTFGQGDGLGVLYFLKLLPWYAWPAWPLAAWTVWRARHTLAGRRDLQLPLVACVAFFAVVAVFGESREIGAMPLLLPLAILAVADVESIPRGAASALDWFGMTTFFLFAALIWICWAAALTGAPGFAAAWLQREVPGYAYRFDFVSVSLAALLTLIWVAVAARSLRSTRRALVNWAAGITMVWMLVMTLGVPLVDQARSYRALASRLAAALPADPGCVARRNVGDAQRALLDYFVKLRTVAAELPAAADCRALLVQAPPLRIPAVGVEWAEAWRGSRPGDRNELFILYHR